MKKILVPTDLSDIAEIGVKLAVEIARRTQAVVSLVNFTSHPFGKTFSAMGDVNTKIDEEGNLFTAQLLRANKLKLDALVAKYSQQGIIIESAIVDDELKEGVDAYLHTEKVDLVVMGTSGEENATEQFTGNHTEQVIKISTCPVLSVRDGFNIQEFANICLAISNTKNDHILQALTSLRTLADDFDATVHFVHILNNHDEYEERRENFNALAVAAGFKKFTINMLETQDAAGGVIQFARQVKAGLIGVIKHSNDGIFRIFSNHFSDKLVKEVGRPVFTYNLQNAEG